MLLDLSECTSTPESSQLRTVRDTIARAHDRIQFDACAIVAPTDVLFGMARMFEILAGEHFHVMHVFRSVANAEPWDLQPSDRLFQPPEE